ncbi:MAG: GNAT family N-acetyltransferase [Acidimicrobiia bacterium]
MQPKIHRVGPGDVDVLRATRLRALADAPAAFGTTLAEAESRPRDFWSAQAGGRLGDRPCATWLAVDAAGTGVGMITGVDRGDSISTVQVWVAPHHRGTGLVDRLFGALFEWSPYDRIDIAAAEGNQRARSAYRRIGFEVIGDRVGQHETELLLTRTLPPTAGSQREERHP